MKRHPALVPLSHDHHHALVQARRLERAAESGDVARAAAAADFVRFFSSETVRHFREEEEQLFPVLVDQDGAEGELLARALLEHQRLRALVGRLDRALTAGEAEPALMRELAELLEGHVRLEERQLFPLIEDRAGEALGSLDFVAVREAAESSVGDLSGPRGSGPLWGAETEDLNATLLAWAAGDGPAEHVNSECDVLLVLLAGSATVTIDGDVNAVQPGEVVIVEKGRTRAIEAGPHGARYLSVHRRRAPLQIAARATTSPVRPTADR